MLNHEKLPKKALVVAKNLAIGALAEIAKESELVDVQLEDAR